MEKETPPSPGLPDLSSEKRPVQITQRNCVVENKMFEVFFDKVENDRGETVENYLVVAPKVRTSEGATGVGILPVYHDLFGLIRIYRHPVEDYLWELPRGFIDEQEGSATSAVRELEEEAGLTCPFEELVSLGNFYPDAGTLRSSIHLFAAEGCYPVPRKKKIDFGQDGFRYFSGDEIDEMVRTCQIKDPSTLIALYRYSLLKR